MALAVHLLKTAARPVVNTTTAGTGAPVASVAEDSGALGLSLVAIFAPILVVLALILLALIAWWVIKRVRRLRARRRSRLASP